MESEHKDYAFKNEISLSIGDDSIDSSASTPSTITPPAVPTPSPRQNLNDDTQPLTKEMADDKKKPEGIENKGFEASEKPPLTSFGNGHNNNGLNETPAKNGQMSDKKLTEAVNLELININSNNNNNNMKKSAPTNGKNDLPAKKDEKDIEAGKKDESYDEYFVPVNEHRKYMSLKTARKLHGVDSHGLSLETPEFGVINYSDWIDNVSRGEKLYVTKDKRAETRRNKLCWILCIGVVAAVIILGILAASGAFSKTDTPVEARQFGDKGNDTRVVGAGIGGGIPSDQTTTTSTTQSTTSSTTEQSTIPPLITDGTPSIVPQDEEINYVPNSLEGQITLSNAEYSQEYRDSNSPIYQKFVKDLENEIKNALSSNGNEEFFVKIIGLKSGSVVVDYRISWKPNQSQLSTEEMQKRIQNFLNRNNHQFMSRYSVNENAIRVARVPDRCPSKCEKNGCEFMVDKVDFVCKCPPEQTWDDDWGECVGINDSVYQHEDSTAEPEPEAVSEPSSNSHDEHLHHHHHHHHTEGASPTSEPSSEPSSEPVTEPSSPSSEPEPASAEPTSEPSSDKQDQHHHVIETSSPSSESTPEPSSSTAEPASNSEISSPSSTAEPPSSTAEPSPSSTAEPESSSPKAEPEPEPEPEKPVDDDEEEEENENLFGEEKEKDEEKEEEKKTEETKEEAKEGETVYMGEKQSKVLDEDSTVNSTSPKPVTENIDDTPQPNELFVPQHHARAHNDLNIFDMNSTTQATVSTNGTTNIYSTASPMNIWQSENASETHDMSPFLPETENSQHKAEQKSYSVTENVSESENAQHDQSPFLPESENKHILSGSRGMMSEESEENKKNLTKTDSPIINIAPIVIESTTAQISTNNSESVQTSTEGIKIDAENATTPAVGAESSTASIDLSNSTETESTTTTTTTTSTTEKSDEEEDNENLFGEEVEDEKEEEEHKEEEEAAEMTSSSTVAPESTSENVTESANTTEKAATELEIIPVQVVSEVTTENLSTSSLSTTEQSSTSTTTTEQVSTSTESTTIKASEESSSTTTAKSIFETSTSIIVKENESSEADKIKLSEFDHPKEEKGDETFLGVIPLKSNNIETLTTTEGSLLHTSENEINTEKTETTGHFLEQTTFPSVKSESNETSLNVVREGKVISDEYYNGSSVNAVKNETKEALEKLFKPDFIEKHLGCSDDQFKCINSNECISKVKVCDGKTQCADNSDEWNCNILVNNTNILKINYQDKILNVCATKWTTGLSDKICQKHGYAGAIEWKNNREEVGKDEKYLVLKDNSLNEFEFSESCDDGVVEIHCQEYACGSNATYRDAGEFNGISIVVNKDSTRRCTANIISPLWAITNAECVAKPDEDWVLIAGNSELNMSKISKDSVISLVSEIVTYPGNDYALLHLKQVLTFSETVYSTCMREHQFRAGSECLSTGWLTKEDNSLEKYEKIMTVQGNCTEKADELCVSLKSEPKAECYNDRGAALYCYSKDHKRWLLNGIQSQEVNCKVKPQPLIFTSLAKETIEWIKNTVGNSRMFV